MRSPMIRLYRCGVGGTCMQYNERMGGMTPPNRSKDMQRRAPPA
jgi:hypothetical protein